MQMRSSPSAARRRPNGSRAPVGLWPIAKMPAIVSSLSATASAMPVRVAGSASPANRGRYCSRIASQTSAGSPSCKRVVAPHHALQLREFADHRGKQVALRELGRPGCECRVAADGSADRPGQRAYALGLVVQRAEPRLEGHALECVASRRERLLAILRVEERCVGEPRPDHALVASDDLGRIQALDVRHRDEPGHQPPLGVAHREVPLVILHRCDRDLLRQLEEAGLESPGERDRPLDQGRDLVEQPIVDHRMPVDPLRAASNHVGADPLAAQLEVRQHTTASLERGEIRGGAADPELARAP